MKCILIVCGSRDWTDSEMIRLRLERYDPAETTLFYGACRGADRIAGKIAARLGFSWKEFPANWSKYGKKAGPLRNQQMIDEACRSGFQICVEAFHDNIEASKGTKDMIRRAEHSGIPYRIWGHTGALPPSLPF